MKRQENQKREKRSDTFPPSAEEKKQQNDKPKNMTAAAKKMLALLWEKKYKTLLVLVISIVSTVLSIIGPVYLGDIIDGITDLIKVKLTGQPLDLSAIRQILLTILAIYTASSFAAFLQHFTMAGLNRDLIFKMRRDLNRKLSHLPLRYFDSHTKGDILSRVTNDIDNIQNTFQNNLIQIITSVVSVVGVFAIMLYISPMMTLISVVVLPFGLLLAMALLKVSRRYFRENWRTVGSLNGHIEEMYTGHRIVKVFGHTKQAVAEFTRINGELCEVDRKAQFYSGVLQPIITFTSNIGYILICIFGGIFVVRGKISIGDMTVFFVYSKLFMQPIVDMSNIANHLQSSLASAERVFEVLEQQSEPEDTAIHHLSDNRRKSVELAGVDFSYAAEKTLIRDLNLKVEAGQLIAIVGPTGAGKTTIVNLLMRFYDVDGGVISIDGTDIRTVPRDELRHAFGMVLQDTWLFEGSVKDNIAYGRSDASPEEIVAAAEAAHADHFIRALPNGYDTLLEEDAANISQGQRQLLTIARAILADPDILILDEATSSVDTRTELMIQDAMKELMEGRTSFVIAHRLSTIRKADAILVMDGGCIVETGTHEELIARGGFYKELYDAQFAGATI